MLKLETLFLAQQSDIYGPLVLLMEHFVVCTASAEMWVANKQQLMEGRQRCLLIL